MLHVCPAGEVSILVMIETARAIIKLPEICQASPRLKALIFGAEDLAGDLGATRTREAQEVFYARSAVVTHAAAFELQAIDMVALDYHDTNSLLFEARQGAQMGYSGKQAIHPNQIGPIQAAFTPSAEAIPHAPRLINAYADWPAPGVGALALDWNMAD